MLVQIKEVFIKVLKGVESETKEAIINNLTLLKETNWISSIAYKVMLQIIELCKDLRQYKGFKVFHLKNKTLRFLNSKY